MPQTKTEQVETQQTRDAATETVTVGNEILKDSVAAEYKRMSEVPDTTIPPADVVTSQDRQRIREHTEADPVSDIGEREEAMRATEVVGGSRIPKLFADNSEGNKLGGDGPAAEWKRREEVVVKGYSGGPDVGARSLEQLVDKDARQRGGPGQRSADGTPLERDDGLTGTTTAGLFGSRVEQLTESGALKPDARVTACEVFATDATPTLRFLDGLKESNPEVHARTHMVVGFTSDQKMKETQASGVLNRHAGQVECVLLDEKRPVLPSGTVCALAPEIFNHQPYAPLLRFKDSTQMFGGPAGENVVTNASFVKAKGDWPIVTVDPRTGLADCVPPQTLDLFQALDSQTGREVAVPGLSGRIHDDPQEKTVAEVPSLSDRHQAVAQFMDGGARNRMYHFSYDAQRLAHRLVGQLAEGGILVTNGKMRQSQDSPLAAKDRVQHEGQTIIPVVEGWQLDRAFGNGVRISTVPADSRYDGLMTYKLVDTYHDQAAAEQLSDAFTTQVESSVSITRDIGDCLANVQKYLDAAADNIDSTADASVMDAAIGRIRARIDILEKRYPEVAQSYRLNLTVAQKLNGFWRGKKQKENKLAGQAAAEAAVEYAEKAIVISPHAGTEAYCEAANPLNGLGRAEEAAEYLSIAAAMSPDDFFVHSLIASFCKGHKDYRGYVQALSQRFKASRVSDPNKQLQMLCELVDAQVMQADHCLQTGDMNTFKTIRAIAMQGGGKQGEWERTSEIVQLPNIVMEPYKASRIAESARAVAIALNDTESAEYFDGIAQRYLPRAGWFNPKAENPNAPRTVDRPLSTSVIWDYEGDMITPDDYASPARILEDREEILGAEVATLEHAERLSRQGAESDWNHPYFNSETSQDLYELYERGSFLLGREQELDGKEWSPAMQEINRLITHVFIAGESGGGKTQTIRYILEKLSQQGIHWLAFDPVGNEYSEMGGRVGHSVRILDPANRAMEPIAVHPLDPNGCIRVKLDRQGMPVMEPVLDEHGMPTDMERAVLEVDIEKHKGQVAQMVLTNFDTSDDNGLMETIVSETLPRLYGEYWDAERGIAPTFRQWEKVIEDYVVEQDQSQDTGKDIKAYVLKRIHTLSIAEDPDENTAVKMLFEGGHPVDTAKLTSHDTVVPLAAVGGDEYKGLVMNVVLTKVMNERRRQMALKPVKKGETLKLETDKLEFGIVLEEGHRLAGKHSKWGEDVANLFAEARKLGIGIIVAEQVPGRLHDAVIENTGTKILHRVALTDGGKEFAMSLGLGEDRLKELLELDDGVAFVRRGSRDGSRPMRVHVERGSEGRQLPDDLPSDKRASRYHGYTAREGDFSYEEFVDAQRLATSPESAAFRVLTEMAVLACMVDKELPHVPEELQQRYENLGKRAGACLVGALVERSVGNRTRALLAAGKHPDVLAAKAGVYLRKLLSGSISGGTVQPGPGFGTPLLDWLEQDINTSPWLGRVPRDGDPAPLPEERLEGIPDDPDMTMREYKQWLIHHDASPKKEASAENRGAGFLQIVGDDQGAQLIRDLKEVGRQWGGEADWMRQRYHITDRMGMRGNPAVPTWFESLIASVGQRLKVTKLADLAGQM